jgi:hypothetical protein
VKSIIQRILGEDVSPGAPDTGGIPPERLNKGGPKTSKTRPTWNGGDEDGPVDLTTKDDMAGLIGDQGDKFMKVVNAVISALYGQGFDPKTQSHEQSEINMSNDGVSVQVSQEHPDELVLVIRRAGDTGGL